MSAVYDDVLVETWRQWGEREERVTDSERTALGLSFLLQMGSSLIETLSSISNAPFNLLAQGTSSISARIEQTLRQLTSWQVLIPRPGDVRSYLVKNSDLLDLLPSLCKDVAYHFNPDTKLFLEYYQDPQYGDDEYLTLYIRTDPFDLSMIERIDNVTDAYAEAFSSIKGWILIAPDFRREN